MTEPIEYEIATEDDWERARRNAAQRSTRWQRIVMALERGEIVRLHFADNEERKRATRAIGVVAGRAGFRVDTRDEGEARLYKYGGPREPNGHSDKTLP